MLSAIKILRRAFFFKENCFLRLNKVCILLKTGYIFTLIKEMERSFYAESIFCDNKFAADGLRRLRFNL